MSRFTIINPNDAKCYTFSRARTKRIPLGQAYIAAALKRAGHEVSVLDASAVEMTQEEIVERVVSSKPDFVGIGGTTPLYTQMSSLTKKIKSALPDCVVILGGPHVSSLPIPSLNTSEADFICIGEGEESIVSIVDSVVNKKDPSKIPGIAFKGNNGSEITQMYRLRLNQPVKTTIRAVDLNVIPIPARELYDHSKYVDMARGIESSQTGAMFSRGCPGKSYDKNTEIYTENGWKLFRNLCDEEKVAVYHPDKDDIVFERPKGRLSYHYKDDMIHIVNKQVDIMITSNHVNYCNTVDGVYKNRSYRFEDAINFLNLGKSQQRSFLKGCNNHKGKSDPIIIGNHTFQPEIFFKFMGYYLSEGYTAKKEGSIWIYQNENSPSFQSILQCTKDMGVGSFVVNRKKKINRNAKAIIFKCKDLADYLRPLGRSWEKSLPRELLMYDNKYLQIFLDAYIEGDGSVNTFKGRCGCLPQKTIYTTSKKMLDDIQYITFLLGRAANVYKNIRNGERLLQDHVVKKSRPIYQITIPNNDSHTFINGSDVKRVPYDDMAYCVEVSTGVILIRRNNKVVLNGNCAFCGAAETLVRWRHLDNVIEELKQIQDMGISNLFVMDDTYTNQKKRVLDLSKRIVDEGIKLNISVQLRLDQIDKEICDAIYASGVKYVGPGIESGSEKIMKAIGKGPRESKAHMREKIKLLKEYDWSIRCSYVFGMVGETEDDILETIEFAKELDATENAFSILTPYPDSPLWNVALKMGKVDEYMDFDRFLYYHTVGCNLSEVPTDRLLELHELAYTTVKSRTYALSGGTLHTERPK